MKIYVLLGLIAFAAGSSIRYRREAGEEGSSTDYQHKIDHHHAKSHQSIKFHHFHPVPVYVKKEYAHLLKNPLEIGDSGHKLKQIHPETEHHHGYGLVLEKHVHHHGIHEKKLHDFDNGHVAEIEHHPEHHVEHHEHIPEHHEHVPEHHEHHAEQHFEQAPEHHYDFHHHAEASMVPHTQPEYHEQSFEGYEGH